ncbi:MAG: nucleolar protein 56 [Candidatus Methanomethylophilaceae archaeon]|nr:nucleolar protein 56 [Candidatus Methanomethylophilaceae archaeon]
MTPFLVTKWFGVFLCEGQRIVDSRLFPPDPHLIAEKLARIQRGELLEEEKELVANSKVRVVEQRQSPLGKPGLFDSSFISPDEHTYGKELMHQVMVELGRLRSSEPMARDRNIVEAIRALDNLIESCNILNERLHEWYGIYFPELSDYAHERRYAQLIVDHGNREEIIEELGLELESMGSEMESEDIATIRGMAQSLIDLYERRAVLEKYISNNVGQIAPNLCTLMGPHLTARMISLAGGLERLASLPASTLQLLGAEKAMFRHLRSNKRPPKHGVIYQHPAVHRSPYWQRGNISRALASKAAIAARIDQYGEENRGDILLREFEARVEEIKKKYPQPSDKTRNKKKRRKGRQH